MYRSLLRMVSFLLLLTSSSAYASSCVGLTGDGAIGNLVYNDFNENLTHDADEPGVGGIDVVLYNRFRQEVCRTTTDDDGSYEFTDLPVNQFYFIAVESPDICTIPNQFPPIDRPRDEETSILSPATAQLLASISSFAISDALANDGGDGLISGQTAVTKLTQSDPTDYGVDFALFCQCTPPTASDDSASGDAGQELTIDVLANDQPFGTVNTLIITGSDLGANVSVNANNEIVVSGNVAAGTYTIDYKIFTDCGFARATVTVVIKEKTVVTPPWDCTADIFYGRGASRLSGAWRITYDVTDEFGGLRFYHGTQSDPKLIREITYGTLYTTYYDFSAQREASRAELAALFGIDGSIIPDEILDTDEQTAPSYDWWGQYFRARELRTDVSVPNSMTLEEYESVIHKDLTFFKGKKLKFVSAIDSNGNESELVACEHQISLSSYSPIAIDVLDTGKVDRIQTGIHFDITGNGKKEHLGEWFAPSAGILIDASIPGEITGEHLFGDMGGLFPDGYAKLAQLDFNQDGVVSGAEMTSLGIWRDLNSNAVMDKGEFATLSAYNIASLSTSHSGFVSSAMRTDGTKIMTEDLWFPVVPPVAAPVTEVAPISVLTQIGALIAAMMLLVGIGLRVYSPNKPETLA